MTILKKQASPLKRARKAYSDFINAQPHQRFKVNSITTLADGTVRRTEALVPRKDLLKTTGQRTDTLIPLSRHEIKELRLSLDVSQKEFANWLDVSIQAVHKWEQSTGVLGGPILRLLRIVEANKVQWRKRLRNELSPSRRSPA